MAARSSAGRIIPLLDCQISAVASLRRMAVATRNVLVFQDIKVQVVNPWTMP